MKTNLGKTREELIFQLLISLNQGDSFYVDGDSNRTSLAIRQYNELVEKGVIVETE